MANIVQISDFKVGRFKIPQNSYQGLDLQDYIDKYHTHYLVRLLGVDLFNLFIADLDAQGVPQNPIYVALYEPFIVQDPHFCESEGMKEMIKAFIYFHYVRDTVTRMTTNGPKQSKSENSVSLEITSHDLTTRFNEGVSSYECIQFKAQDEKGTNYPEFDGILLERVLPI